MYYLPVISVQTDFSFCEAGQATGRPTARFERTTVLLTLILILKLFTDTVLVKGTTAFPCGLSPSPRLLMNFLAFSARVGSPGGKARV